MIPYKKNWIDKLITHNRDYIGDYGSRFTLHIPAGFIAGLLPGFLKLFTHYEENEDAHTKDQAWKDYAGAMWGFAFGRGLLIAFTIWFLLQILDLAKDFIRIGIIKAIMEG